MPQEVQKPIQHTGINTKTNETPAPPDAPCALRSIRQDELSDFSNVGAIANIEIREAKGRDFAKLTIAMFESGERIDTITVNANILDAIRTLKMGTLVQFHSMKQENLSYPVLQDLAIVS